MLLMYAMFTKMPIDEIELPQTENWDGSRRDLQMESSPIEDTESDRKYDLNQYFFVEVNSSK